MLLTLLVCLVDATDLLGVTRGQDLNQTALVRASSLNVKAEVRWYEPVDRVNVQFLCTVKQIKYNYI